MGYPSRLRERIDHIHLEMGEGEGPKQKGGLGVGYEALVGWRVRLHK